MSVVSNYKFTPPNKVEFIGDYKNHKGNPSLLRSDSMLKAIGKSINIRVSGIASTKIPIVVLGNSPITDSYIKKVDFLKTSGVLQGFWSLNPEPTHSNYIKNTYSRYRHTSRNINFYTYIRTFQTSPIGTCKKQSDNRLRPFIVCHSAHSSYPYTEGPERCAVASCTGQRA